MQDKMRTIGKFDTPMTPAAQRANEKFMELTSREMHRRASVLENRIRQGCTGCGTAIIEHSRGELRPVPGSTVIHKVWYELQPGEDDIGRPYCGQCLYKMGIACLPGDDYVI